MSCSRRDIWGGNSAAPIPPIHHEKIYHKRTDGGNVVFGADVPITADLMEIGPGLIARSVPSSISFSIFRVFLRGPSTQRP